MKQLGYFSLRIDLYVTLFLAFSLLGFGCSRENGVKEIRTLFQSQKYEAAQSLLDRFLFNHPHDVSGLELQCELSVAMKQWNTAFVVYDSLRLSMNKNHLPVLEHICREFLLDGLHSSSVDVRETVIKALARLEDPSFLPIFMHGATDTSLAVRAECVRALGFFNEFSTTPILRLNLAGKDTIAKLYSAAALFMMGEETESNEYLKDAFLSNNELVQRSLLEILRPVRRPSLLPLLKIACGSPSIEIRLPAIEHIALLGHQTLAFGYLEEVFRALEGLQESQVVRALDILGMLSVPPAMSLLENFASGKHPGASLITQLLALRIAAKNGYPFANLPMDQFMGNQDSRIRLLAAEAAYYLNHDQGVKLIARLGSGNFYDVSFLCSVNDPLLIPLLAGILPSVPFEQKIDIASALARFRNLSGISDLLHLCKSSNTVESHQAAGAVLKILKMYQGLKMYRTT